MNNTELKELARRAVASKHWRWMPGMLACCLDRECFIRVVDLEDKDLTTSIPDLSDPATLGCLLALVREAWKNPHVYVDYSNKWKAAFCCDVGLRAFSSTTEAAALVAALESAP